ncbi:uncharacterized protein LOC122080015 [Macadamia integrifolia]|uniref:uncharacterized protein LOC122080015 n=1 Tax=Macadamia integrifolia TaxID=60698 RepID=UPI001C5001EC|nr:uncharacterized protein LOC122080015 [Macadamia integrifolia]
MAGAGDDVMSVHETKPDSSEIFLASESPDCTEKYKKYEADYVHRLKAKYFSRKNLYGGVIFDSEVTIDGEIIKSSGWPCTRSFTDPVQSFKDQSMFLASAAENSTNHPNKKHKSYILFEDPKDAASVDMDKVDQLRASLDVPYVTADPSVNSEVEALSGPEAETIAQPSSMEVHAEEQTMRLEGPPVDELSIENAEASEVGAADIPSTSTCPPLTVEAAKSSKFIQERGI